MKVTQEQVDQYVADTLQPLVDALVEYAQGKKLPAPDFYIACLTLTMDALERSSGSQAERVSKELRSLGSELVVEEIIKRMGENKCL